jgi:hypothetical protein
LLGATASHYTTKTSTQQAIFIQKIPHRPENPICSKITKRLSSADATMLTTRSFAVWGIRHDDVQTTTSDRYIGWENSYA